MTPEELKSTRRGVWGLVGLVAFLAFATGADHVTGLAGRSGQDGWKAWSSVLCVELLPASAWMVRRYRERAGLPPSPLPYICIGLGLAVSVAAQLADAKILDWLPWTAIYAVLPVVVVTLVGVMAETTLVTPPPQPAPPPQEAKSSTPNTPRTRIHSTRPSQSTPPKGPKPNIDTQSHQDAVVDKRISGKDYVAQLVAQLEKDDEYKPDLKAEAETTGWSYSWVEKRWRQAREAYAAGTVESDKRAA